MIHLVLDGNSFKAGGRELPHGLVQFTESNSDFRGTVHVAGVIRNTHAPFTHGGDSSALQNLRVDHGKQAMVVVFAMSAGRYINHANAQGDAYLRGCHAHRTGAGPHGVQQVFNEGMKLLVYKIYLIADFLQQRVRVAQNSLDWHIIKERLASRYARQSPRSAPF